MTVSQQGVRSSPCGNLKQAAFSHSHSHSRYHLSQEWPSPKPHSPARNWQKQYAEAATQEAATGTNAPVPNATSRWGYKTVEPGKTIWTLPNSICFRLYLLYFHHIES
ncbi:hypothetical protein DL89DRAFT_301692 [Linderina pennispora]|uniref:Uncharacterized protein n=1 Tax=Linderina pennispora TaxID=61395 RepID=A0A1Y1W3T9_9FUNG|nr:uncharacterized protein DL89DRAFT_301692 [Linderina pennispora]ORX68181.1 hypothetical protein DL89DRAFT_301692 [Linderina pennispora]